MRMPWIFEYGEEAVDEPASPTTNSSTTSSIGKNSDLWQSYSPESEDCKEENEVESPLKLGKQGLMDALEEALPIKRGISEFYSGRSKSFACLDEPSSFPSIKEIAKRENAYHRRRRNLLAVNHSWAKKTEKPIIIRSSQIRTEALGVALLSRSESTSSRNSEYSISNFTCHSFDSKSSSSSSPLHLNSSASYTNLVSFSSLQQNAPRRRSVSLPDLHVPKYCPTTETTSSSSPLVNHKN